jgi:hypothetical protein
MSDFNSEEYLTKQEAMARLGVSEYILWSRATRGDLHPMRLGARVFYLRDEVDTLARNMEDMRGKILVGRLAAPRGSRGKSPIDKTPTGGTPTGSTPAGSTLLTAGLPTAGLPTAGLPTAGLPTAGLPTAGLLTAGPARSKLEKNAAPPKGLPYTGDEAASAFKMWDAGKNKRQAVEELKLRCDIVEHLYDKWQEFGDELHIPPKMVEIMRARFKWSESPPTARGFWMALVTFVDQEMRRQSSKKTVYEPITDEERRLLHEEERSIPEKPALPHSASNTSNANNQNNTPKTPEPDDDSLSFC